MTLTHAGTAVSDALLIERIEVVQVFVPKRSNKRILTALGVMPDAPIAMVKVYSEGLVGVGEAATDYSWTGEDVVTVRHAVERYLAPAIVGQRLGIRAAVGAMNFALFGNLHAKGAVEAALWDLLARRANLSLSVLLGGSGPRPIPLRYTIGIKETSEAVDEAVFARELGIRHFKVKVGLDLPSNLARLAAVMEAAGSDARVGIDPQSGWDILTSLAALDPLAEMGCAFLEQPVHRESPDHFAQITARSKIPTIAHESALDPASALENAQRRVANIWALSPMSHAGLLSTLDILAVARLARIPILMSGTVELGIGTAFSGHVASAFDEIVNCPVGSCLIGTLYHDGDVVTPGIEVKDGHLIVPDGPGIGVELDQQ